MLGVFFVLPVGGMLGRGPVAGRHVRPGAVLDVLARPRIHRVLWFTVWTSSVATAVAVLLGLPAAYALHRLDFPLRGAIRAALLVPFVLPTVVVGVAFRQLLREQGPLGFLGLDGTPVAILMGLVFFNVAVVIRTVGAAWERPRPSPGGGRRRARGDAGPGLPHRHPAGAAPGDRLRRRSWSSSSARRRSASC